MKILTKQNIFTPIFSAIFILGSLAHCDEPNKGNPLLALLNEALPILPGTETDNRSFSTSFNNKGLILEQFGIDQGWFVEYHPREMADIDGDGRADIVAFSTEGVRVGISNGDGTFTYKYGAIAQFGYNQGWRLENHPRLLADINGDGMADIIGFSDTGVDVGISNGDGTFTYHPGVLAEFNYNQFWRTEKHPRLMADINGDGMADIVGFGEVGVQVAISNGDGTFTHHLGSVADFGYDQSWRIEKHPRLMADINGDGKADIVGFASEGVRLGISNGDGTFTHKPGVLAQFGAGQGWTVADHPRLMGDINGDGNADIVGFHVNGVEVGISNGDGTFTHQSGGSELGTAGGWQVKYNPRMLVDINGDGMADILGFAYTNLRYGIANGSGSFSWRTIVLPNFCYNQGWLSATVHRRFLSDVSGDGRPDIVGFANAGVHTAINQY